MSSAMKKMKISALITVVVMVGLIVYEDNILQRALSTEASAKRYVEKLDLSEDVSWQELATRGKQLYEKKRYYESIEMFKLALNVAERDHGRGSAEVVHSLNALYTAYNTVGKFDEAQTIKEQKDAIVKEYGVSGNPLGLSTAMNYIEWAQSGGKWILQTWIYRIIISILLFFLIFTIMSTVTWVRSQIKKH